MTPAELRELADRISVGTWQDDADRAAAHLRACADALEKGPVAWAATDETGKTVEALGMNRTRRFSDPLYLRPLPAQAQALRLPEPMTEAEIVGVWQSLPKNNMLVRDGSTTIRLSRAIEAEVIRRIKELNE